MTRTELIAALEAAEGPSRELDGKIAEALGWLWLEPAISGPGGWFPPDSEQSQPVPSYSESIDAALSFTPEEALGWECGKDLVSGRSYVAVLMPMTETSAGGEIHSVALTPAIALCIANLRALEAQEEE